MKLTKSKLREIIKEVIREIDFKDKESFQKYKSKHKMRPSTKITIGGKQTTVGKASNGQKGNKASFAASIGKKSSPIDTYAKKKRTSSSFKKGSKFKASLDVKFTKKQLKDMKADYKQNDGEKFTIEIPNTDPILKRAFGAVGSDDYLELQNIEKIENIIKKVTGAEDVWDSYDDNYQAGDEGHAQYFDIEGVDPEKVIKALQGKKIPLNYEVN